MGNGIATDRAPCQGLSHHFTQPQNICGSGELEHVCVGTGPLESLGAYVARDYTDTIDERGGAMALWFAAELAAAVVG